MSSLQRIHHKQITTFLLIVDLTICGRVPALRAFILILYECISKDRTVCMFALHLSHSVSSTATEADRRDHTGGVSHSLNTWYFPSFGIWPCANI